MKKLLIAAGLIVAMYASQGTESGITAAARQTNSSATPSDRQPVFVTPVNLRAGKADVNIHNTSGQKLESVFVRCTFRDNSGTRIDVAPVMAYSIGANETARETASIASRTIANSVDCQVKSVRKA